MRKTATLGLFALLACGPQLDPQADSVDLGEPGEVWGDFRYELIALPKHTRRTGAFVILLNQCTGQTWALRGGKQPHWQELRSSPEASRIGAEK